MPTIKRKLDALPDTIDFRDAMYAPSLIEIPRASDLDAYRKAKIPVLDQGSEGACTGFGLATVANYLLRGRGRGAKADEVSAWMLYTMAKRYDEWPGEKYSGSSARGAMKGWHKHGVCALRLWKDLKGDAEPVEKISADALDRPLGAYFRVNHKDLVAMHSALAEVGILYATSAVHQGWADVRKGDSDIVYSPRLIGSHAFAIVGYDREGLWIQNSWGYDWGLGGLARISYDDWLENGTDVWVAALGVPIERGRLSATLRAVAPLSYQTYTYSALRPHIVTSRNDGRLDPKGTYGLTPEGLADIVDRQMPARMNGWAKKRVMLHAHGGLVSENSAIQYVANNHQSALAAQVYPLSFVWRSDALTTIKYILQDAFSRRRDEGFLDAAKDFMLDRIDDTLEPLARILGGKALWDEMKENARLATEGRDGAARMTADLLARQHRQGALDEIHLVGHSAGAIFHAHLAKYLVSKSVPIESLTLWAPACTIELFKSLYLPMIENKDIRAFRLFTLDKDTEEDDDCAGIYHKSLLHLVSAAFEKKPRIPLLRKGVSLLGLERDVKKEIDASFWKSAGRRWIVAPAAAESDATHHGDFDNDRATLDSTLDMIRGSRAAARPSTRVRAATRRSVVRRRQGLELALALPAGRI